MTVGQLLDHYAQRWQPGDVEFRKVLHAIALAESGGNPGAIGDNGQSFGIFQNYMKGRGAGHNPQDLLDADYNIRISVPELHGAYIRGIQQGLRGKDLVAYVSRIGQRPAAGNEWQAAGRYGQFVAGVETGRNPSGVAQAPQMPQIVPKAMAAEPSTQAPMSTQTPMSTQPQTQLQTQPQTHTVRPGQTLWGIADRYLGSGFKWRQLQGYTGDPRKMPIGTQITIPQGAPQGAPQQTQAIRTEQAPQSFSQATPNFYNNATPQPQPQPGPTTPTLPQDDVSELKNIVSRTIPKPTPVPSAVAKPQAPRPAPMARPTPAPAPRPAPRPAARPTPKPAPRPATKPSPVLKNYAFWRK